MTLLLRCVGGGNYNSQPRFKEVVGQIKILLLYEKCHCHSVRKVPRMEYMYVCMGWGE
jgi:hypothetical protein